MKKLIRFHAEWCGPCKSSYPAWLRFQKQNEVKFEFTEVDVDFDPATALKYNVMSVPTVIYEDDGKVIDKHVGSFTVNSLINLVS
jgi:thioredoxin 1